MKDWCQYRSWNLTHRAQLRESRHMTYHTTALLLNSCGPMADGPFRHPKARSYPHPKYWTHRWRSEINISLRISPIALRQSRHMTYHTTALLSNSCCPMADGTFRDRKGHTFALLLISHSPFFYGQNLCVCPINTTTIGLIDRWLISRATSLSIFVLKTRESHNMEEI